MVVFDATFLMLFLDSRVNDGVGNSPNVDYLVETLIRSRARIIVPTPALSELLVGAGDAAPQYLDILNRSAYFRVEPFGTKAAVEAAAAIRDAKAKGGKRGQGVASSWAKVKFDRQIVAIAKVNSASVIYSDDDDIKKLGKAADIAVISLDELPMPPTPPQIEMDLPPKESTSTDEIDEN
jgi:predicted nucleic acid-binding protein